MRKVQKESILISFFKEKEKYEKLAEYLVLLIRDDPSSPKESLHTVTYRIKDAARLIEKIEEENNRPGRKAPPITQKNFQKRIGDLLGIRLICLRLSDIKRVETYLKLLAKEKILRFLRRPDQKRSFILPIDMGEEVPENPDLQPSGYSSVHYQIELGENSDATDELKGLQIELQLRTILEEAWGEIDHKYRYKAIRSGYPLPEYIQTGFYSLSAYLQAAALQAEYLCQQAERHRLLGTGKARGALMDQVVGQPGMPQMGMNGPDQAPLPSDLKAVLEEIFGFKPTVRTIMYILKRLVESGYTEQNQALLRKIFTKNRLQDFRTTFREILNREAFADHGQRNVDAINAVNFVLFNEIQGSRVAQEELRSVLRWRKGRSSG